MFEAISMAGSSNFLQICHLYEIFTIKMCITLTLIHRNVNMPIKNLHMTSYLMTIVIVMLTITVTIYETLAIEMCIILTITFIYGPKSNINMLNESLEMTFNMYAIVIFAIRVTIYEIFTNENKIEKV